MPTRIYGVHKKIMIMVHENTQNNEEKRIKP